MAQQQQQQQLQAMSVRGLLLATPPAAGSSRQAATPEQMARAAHLRHAFEQMLREETWELAQQIVLLKRPADSGSATPSAMVQCMQRATELAAAAAGGSSSREGGLLARNDDTLLHPLSGRGGEGDDGITIVAAAPPSSPPSSSSSSSSHSILRVTSALRQYYCTTWSFSCFLGMVGIAAAFIVQRIVDEVRMGDSSRAVGNGMSKDTAMLLVFSYAALAWMMSNGIILNPRGKLQQ